jgi:hypothetical protein
MATAPDNFERLREAGIMRVGRDECPEKHVEVIDRLTDNEVKVLLDVWDRLQATDPEGRKDWSPGDPPRWTTCGWY